MKLIGKNFSCSDFFNLDSTKLYLVYFSMKWGRKSLGLISISNNEDELLFQTKKYFNIHYQIYILENNKIVERKENLFSIQSLPHSIIFELSKEEELLHLYYDKI